MIRLCVFDMDGLLLDSERQMYVAAGLKASKEVGRPIDEGFFPLQMGGSWANYENHLLETYGQDYPIEEFWKIYDAFVDDMINNGSIPLRPGVLKMLDYCKKNDIRMAIATSTQHEDCLKCLKNAGIYDYFDEIVTVDMVKQTKPDPEIFLKAISLFDVKKEEVLVFEDGHNGALAARNGGCRLVLVEDLALLTEEDKEYADLVTDNICNAIDLIKRENERTAAD